MSTRNKQTSPHGANMSPEDAKKEKSSLEATLIERYKKEKEVLENALK